MLQAGGIEATVTLADGRHVTLSVRTRVRSVRGSGYANASPTDDGARSTIKVQGIRIGWINVNNGEWTVTLRTRREEYRDGGAEARSRSGSRRRETEWVRLQAERSPDGADGDAGALRAIKLCP
jgi:hypothetical protein